ncbi:MAG: hypothetical protein GXO87_14455 [Chlorobi bacterium]|nr:hypothetical protein [Chlorobiota bacterium]
MKRKLPEHIISSVPPKNIFDFSDENSYGGFFVIGYPHWDAYVSAAESEFWIGVVPNINLTERTIELPKIERDEKKKRAKKVHHNFEPFFDSIPKRIIRLAGRYNDSHWDLVKAIILLGKDFEELIKTNPAMAYLIVKLNEINTTFQLYNETELLKKLIRTKQKEILRLAFFPATESMRKILGKINPEFISRESFILFNRFIVTAQKRSDRIIKLLTHIDSINENLMRLLSYFPELSLEISNKLISELINEKDFDALIIKLERIRKRSASVNIPFPKISLVAEINTVDKTNLERVREKKKALESFPAPPIDGNEIITPLLTVKEQISWSRKQRNCIKDFTGSVKRKRSYFYKINFEKEEATLEIKLRNGEPVFGDLLGTGNKKVSPELRTYVKRWFSNAQNKKQN